MAYSTPQDKIVWIEEYCSIRRQWASGRTVVFTNGCFDILHAGHVDYLQRARNLGDMLVVGLNTDASVRRLKGMSRPVNSQQDRAFVLAGLGCVDYVILFDQDTPLDLIRAVKPQVLVKGGDWAVEDIVGREDVEAAGGEVLSLPLRNGYSTTEMIEKICQMQTRE